ncbi:hypothetical protein HPB52_021822 [Rhipicephalus sanguineus]|uniref:Uncharacterized protein n=1 Tax=Rhipicephalus sanguineus TaxID=34632 RepID=A0A9D4SP86_RHISA|nr:hypothetical protein HPB52_021822 [Rhipicephalus sanguineus]
MLGPYKAPPPSETMLRAMAEPGPVYAERIYNDEYEDEEEGRNYVERVQQSDLQVRSGPPMSTLLTQQLREIALQNQMPMDENVVSSTERVIYECIRKMESSTSDSSEDRPPDTIVKASGMLGPNQPGAMSPMSPQRAVMTPQGIMSPVGPPGMMRGPTPGMIRSPISAGSRGYLPRVPSGPLRVITPRMPVQYPQRWPPSARATPLTPANRGGRRDDDGMTLFPERSLIMLLVFLFLFVLVVVILAISGMNFPGPIRYCKYLVDLHVYIVPEERWLRKRKLARNHVVDYAISAGFIRVLPTARLVDVRREIDRQLGHDVVPKEYVFLRSVGRNFTQVPDIFARNSTYRATLRTRDL